MSHPNTETLADIITVIMETHLKNDHGMNAEQIADSLHQLNHDMKHELIKRIKEAIEGKNNGTSH